MRRTLVCAAALAVGLLAAGTPAAQAEPIGGAQLAGKDVIVDPGPGADPLPDVPASAWVIADLDTGAILAAKAPHVPRPPASTLKTLTALTLIPRMDPDEVYTVTYDDIAIEGSRVGLVEDGTYTVEELFLGLMLQSGNDAAAALANANGGLKKTLGEMNEEAQRLQAFDTVAKTPSGLPADGQVTSAYDLALIAREGLSRQDFLDITGTIEVLDYPGYMPDEPGGKRETFAIANQNPLLNPIDGNEPYEGAIGGKTGWTTEAGKTFMGAAERKGMRLVVTLLNFAIPTYDAAAPLLDWGFANADKVTPIGYLVDPVAPAFDEPPAPATPDGAGAGEAQEGSPTAEQGTTGAAEPGAPVAAGASIAAAGSWTSGWAWGLIAAMAVGVLLIVLGIRSLRDNSRGRRARPRGDGGDGQGAEGREREPAGHA
ncbi:MAG: D-alanyl-D-alanine carboxypeptidase family protein [bacterium]